MNSNSNRAPPPAVRFPLTALVYVVAAIIVLTVLLRVFSASEPSRADGPGGYDQVTVATPPSARTGGAHFQADETNILPQESARTNLTASGPYVPPSLTPLMTPASTEALATLTQCHRCWREWLATLQHSNTITDTDIALTREVIRVGGENKAALAALMNEADTTERAGFTLAALLVNDDSEESFGYVKHAILTAHAQKRLPYRHELLFALHETHSPQGLDRARLFYEEVKGQGDQALTSAVAETMTGLMKHHVSPEFRVTETQKNIEANLPKELSMELEADKFKQPEHTR